MIKKLEVRAWEFRRDTWYHNVREVILSEPRHTEEKWPLCRIADAQAEIAGFKQYAATLAAERDELFAALQHPSYAEENKLRAERDALAKELANKRERSDIASHANAEYRTELASLKAQAKELAELHAERDGWKINAEQWALENMASLRASPWIGQCQNCGHEHEAPRVDESIKAQSEPVAWIYTQGGAKVASMNYVAGVKAQPLYTHPAPTDKDGKRLDYLQERGATVFIRLDGSTPLFEIGGLRSTLNRDIRAAVDTALAALAKEGKP